MNNASIFHFQRLGLGLEKSLVAGLFTSLQFICIGYRPTTITYRERRELCKNGWIDRGAIWGVYTGAGPYETRIYGSMQKGKF